MRRVMKMVGLLLIVALIVLQFIQPDKNIQEDPSDTDLFLVMDVPEQVASLLKNSCCDCHSNQTRYPWYNKISPVSWFLNKHVLEGKEALNFSEFGGLGTRKMITAFSGICEVIEAGRMPLTSYTLVHRDAGLSEEDVHTLCDWSEANAEQLMKAGIQAKDP